MAPNGDRPVPTIHTAMSSAKVTSESADQQRELLHAATRTSWIVVDAAAKPALL